MKKLLAVVLIALLVGSFSACKQIDQPTTTTTTEKSSVSTTETSKPSVLTEKVNESILYSNAVEEATDPTGYYFIHGGEDHFFFYDIDGDGTKEWLLGTDVNREKRRPEDGKDVYLRGVCSIQDGVVVRQNLQLGEADTPPVVFKDGTIKCEFRDYTPRLYIYYYHFENGEIKTRIWLFEANGEYFISDEKRTYEPILKEEFERLQKAFEGDGQTVELDWRPLAEWGQ